MISGEHGRDQVPTLGPGDIVLPIYADEIGKMIDEISQIEKYDPRFQALNMLYSRIIDLAYQSGLASGFWRGYHAEVISAAIEQAFGDPELSQRIQHALGELGLKLVSTEDNLENGLGDDE